MSFNGDQLEYMRYLGTLDRKELSWCGLYKKGECAKYHGDKCADINLSNKDKCINCYDTGKIHKVPDGGLYPKTSKCCNCQGSGFSDFYQDRSI